MNYRTFTASILLLLIQTICYSQELSLGIITLKNGTTRSGVLVADSPGEFCVLRDGSGREEVHWYTEIAEKAETLLPPDSPLLDEWALRSADVLSSASAVTYDSVHTVYLKNGTVKKGVIVSEDRHRSIVLLYPNGEEWRYDYKYIDRIESAPMPEGVRYLKIRHFSPPLAGTCSLFFPGGGQYYNEQWLKGVLFTAVEVWGISKGFFGSDDLRDMLGGMLVLLVVHVASIMDAASTASSREKERTEWQREQKTRSASKTSSIHFNLNMAPVPQGAAVGVSVRF